MQIEIFRISIINILIYILIHKTLQNIWPTSGGNKKAKKTSDQFYFWKVFCSSENVTQETSSVRVKRDRIQVNDFQSGRQQLTPAPVRNILPKNGIIMAKKAEQIYPFKLDNILSFFSCFLLKTFSSEFSDEYSPMAAALCDAQTLRRKISQISKRLTVTITNNPFIKKSVIFLHFTLFFEGFHQQVSLQANLLLLLDDSCLQKTRSGTDLPETRVV